jgi:PAS domain S-box-containing protein
MDAATAARVEQLSRLWRALRSELLHHRDEAAIFACACRIATEVGPFVFAWVGLPDADSGRIHPVSAAGQGAGYLDAITVAIADQPEAYGPTASSLRAGQPVVCTDIATDPRMAPWRAAAARFGFRSSGAFPFRRAGQLVGTLSVYAAAPGFADPLEQFLLEGVAEDIGIALDLLDESRARAQAESHLAISERRYRTLFEGSSDGIFVADRDLRIIDVNPAGCQLTGNTRAEILALRLPDLLPAEDRVYHPFDLDAVPLDTPFYADRRLLKKGGDIASVELSGVRHADGTLHMVVRDVTERRRLFTLRATTERMTSLGRLAQGVGHEVNNPLAYLVLNLEDLQNQVDALPEATRAALRSPLEHAQDGAERIKRIVRSLATFGRGDAETLGPVSVVQSIQAARALTANRVKHVTTLELALDNLPPVQANEFQLTQIWVNLFLNAADAMAEVPRPTPHVLRVNGRVVDGRVVVDVSDTGPGIPPEQRDLVFDPYFTTKSIGAGTGLGLAICRGILDTFKASIEVVTHGPGACFRVSLPLAVAPIVEAVRPSRRLALPPMKILVVDDEPLIARSIARLLVGHEVVIVEALNAAIDLCRTADFDRILCDLMFPGGSSEPFYRMLLAERPDLARRFAFMSGGAFTASAQAFLDGTKRPRLAKPFTVKELQEVLASLPSA